MSRTFREAFLAAVEATNKSVRGIALSAGLKEDQLKSLAQGKSRTMNVDDAKKVAAVFGVTLDDFYEGKLAQSGQPTIAIAGLVGAGARVPVFDAYEKGDGPQVVCPPGIGPSGVVAVEVEGDSMEPVYSAGDLLFYTRHSHEGVPAEALGRRCVCEDLRGDGWVKLIREGRSPGTFDLHSFNNATPPMYGVLLKWAAPVRLHWPAELAERTK